MLINGEPVRQPKGAYCFEWRENGRRIRVTAGKDGVQANLRRLRQEQILKAQASGIKVLASAENAPGTSLAQTVHQFLGEIRLKSKKKTCLAYELSLKYFLESCHKQTLEEIDRKDMPSVCSILAGQEGAAPSNSLQQIRERGVFLKEAGRARFG